MSHDQIERIIKKLDCFEKKLDDHVLSSTDFRNETKAFMEALMPVRDGLIVFQHIIKFLKFIGIPSTVVLGAAYWLLKRL